MEPSIEKFELKDDGFFPNSHLPVLFYKNALKLPILFPATYIKKLFENNYWYNTWDGGIITHHHYHSITHEVLGIYKGRTTLQLGGKEGIKIIIEKGDVLIIPAGVAHRNLGKKNDVKCIGAYPYGRNYDMNYGNISERPQAEKNLAAVPIQLVDPVFGSDKGLSKIWRH